jgi:hypothetical protein
MFNLCVDSVFFPADSSHGIHYHFIHMLAIATKFISVAVLPFRPSAEQHLPLASLAWQLEPLRFLKAFSQIVLGQFRFYSGNSMGRVRHWDSYSFVFAYGSTMKTR